MTNKNPAANRFASIPEKLQSAAGTGKEMIFYEDVTNNTGTPYEFTPSGLRDYVNAGLSSPAVHNLSSTLTGATVPRTILDRFDKDTVDFADHLDPALATNSTAVSAAFTTAKTRAAQLGRAIEIKSALDIYTSDVNLSDVAILGSGALKGPYTTAHGTRLIQADKTKSIFNIGKNVLISGLIMDNLFITDAAATAAISAAGAVTAPQIKTAVEGAFSGAAMIKTLLGNMSTVTLDNILVPVCWDFMQCGDTPQFYVMGAVQQNNMRIFSMHRDYLGYSSAEANDLTDSIFSFSPSAERWSQTGPVVSYANDYGAFLEVMSAGSNYNSFDGFNVHETVVFSKKYMILVTNGTLSVSRWDSVHMDGASTAVEIGPAGRIQATELDLATYSYRFPIAADADYTTRYVVKTGGLSGQAVGASQFTLNMKSDYSSGPVALYGGDLADDITGEITAKSFGAGGTTAVVGVTINNANAIITQDLDLKSAQSTHTAFKNTAGTFRGRLDTRDCKYSVERGGVNEKTTLITPTSINTTTSDVTGSSTGKLVILGSSNWSNQTNPAGTGAIDVYLGTDQNFAAAGAGTPTVLQLNTEVHDLDGAFNNSTYLYTAPVAGLYDIELSDILISSNGTLSDRWGIDIRKNGSTFRSVSRFMESINIKSWPGIRARIQLAAGDTIDIAVFRAAGTGQITFLTNSAFSHLYIRRV